MFYINVPIGLAVSPPCLLSSAGIARTARHTGSTCRWQQPRHWRPPLRSSDSSTPATTAATSALVPLAIAAALYGGFVVIQRAVRSPLVNLKILARRPSWQAPS